MSSKETLLTKIICADEEELYRIAEAILTICGQEASEQPYSPPRTSFSQAQ